LDLLLTSFTFVVQQNVQQIEVSGVRVLSCVYVRGPRTYQFMGTWKK